MVFKFNDSLSFNDFLQYLPKNEHGLSLDMLENTLLKAIKNWYKKNSQAWKCPVLLDFREK